MAAYQFKLIARRDDGALLVDVQDSPCVLTVEIGEDRQVQVWANTLDAVTARGNWAVAAGVLPPVVVAAVNAFTGQPGWCDEES